MTHAEELRRPRGFGGQTTGLVFKLEDLKNLEMLFMGRVRLCDGATSDTSTCVNSKLAAVSTKQHTPIQTAFQQADSDNYSEVNVFTEKPATRKEWRRQRKAMMHERLKLHWQYAHECVFECETLFFASIHAILESSHQEPL